jgi:hypothetical protein
MKDTPQHLKTLVEIEREGLPGLVEVLREEGLDDVRYVLWTWRLAPWLQSPRLAQPATEEQKRRGWEMAVRIEKILCTVLHEAHKQQIEEVMDTLSERPEGFYKSLLPVRNRWSIRAQPIPRAAFFGLR